MRLFESHRVNFWEPDIIEVESIEERPTDSDKKKREDWETEIEMPNGKILKSSEIVDGLHLDCFVYTKAEQVEDGD